MPHSIVRKQLVCSDCGSPIIQEYIPTEAAVRTAARSDDDFEEDLIAEDNGEYEVDTVIEEGPVCSKCAGYR